MKKIFSFLIAALFSVSMFAADYWFVGEPNNWTAGDPMESSAHGVYKYVQIAQQSTDIKFKFQTTKDSWDNMLNRNNNVPGFAGTDITDMNSSTNTWETANENCGVYYADGPFYIIVYEAGQERGFNTTSNPIICASTSLPAEYPDSTTYYFVNVPGWEAVYAYSYTDNDNHGKAWPGDAAVNTGVKQNGYDIWSVKTPDAHANIIFTNDDGAQTADLEKNSASPYFYPERLDGSDKYDRKWYTQATLPSERTVYFVNHKGWSFANAHAYKISQDKTDYAKPWPGLSMTETNQTINGYNVYGVKFSSYFDAVVFNNKSGETGEELPRVQITAATSYYYKGTLYTSIEDIPAAEIKLNGAYGEAAKADTDPFVVATNKETASLTIVMEEVGTYNFNVKKDDIIIAKNNGGNVYNLNRNWRGVRDLGDGTDGLSVTIDKAGSYTFNYTYATDSLGVDFPDLENSAVTITGTSHVAITVMGETTVTSGDNVEELTELTISTLAGTGYRVKHLRAYKTDDETTEVAITDGKLTMPGYAITITCDEGESLANGFYLKKTTVALDDITADLKFSDADGQGERTLTTSLTEGNKFKVVEITNNAIVGWYPDGIDNDYTVDANHAGTEKIVYFRQADYDGEGWWYKHIYVPENPVDPTAIDNTEAGAKAVKRLVNGQLVIVKGDKTFNALGTEVK